MHCVPVPVPVPVSVFVRGRGGASLTFLVAEVIVRHVVSSAAAAAAGHLRLAVALEAREPSLAVRVLITIALAFATLIARRAAGTSLVDESAYCACTMTTVISWVTKCLIERAQRIPHHSWKVQHCDMILMYEYHDI